LLVQHHYSNSLDESIRMLFSLNLLTVAKNLYGERNLKHRFDPLALICSFQHFKGQSQNQSPVSCLNI